MQELLSLLMVFANELFSRFCRWLTFRRVVGIILFLIALLFLKQLVLIGTDLSVLFGLDLALTAEVSALIIVLSARHHIMAAHYVVRRGLARVRPISRLLRRSVRRAFRSRIGTPHSPPPPEDRPAEWPSFIPDLLLSVHKVIHVALHLRLV
jgi:hypothetical protein